MFSLAQAQQETIYDWVHNVTGIYTVFAAQEGVRPERPYAVVHMLSYPRSNYLKPSKESISDEIVSFNYSEVFTLSIMIKAGDDAMKHCTSLMHSLDKPSFKGLLHQAGLYPKYCYPPVLSDKTAYTALPTRVEYTAVIDIVFGRATSFEVERDIIEEVEINYEED